MPLRVIEVTGAEGLNDPAPLIFTTMSVTSAAGAQLVLVLPVSGERKHIALNERFRVPEAAVNFGVTSEPT